VVRHHVVGVLTPGQPLGEHGALARAWPAGHGHPAIDAMIGDQELIEPGQEHGAPHEPVVSLSFCHEVEPRRLRW
jgi:hypothetical protein